VNAQKLLTKLYAAHSKYAGACSHAETQLRPLVEFDDFSIFHQPSDGFVMEYEANNASLAACLAIINEKGKLSLEDYMRIRI
jgi:hypothetical protein